MNILAVAVLCVIASTSSAYYRRRYGNYGGYRGFGRRYGYGSVGDHGNHAHISPGHGVNHVDLEVTHVPHGDHVDTITRAVPHVYAGNGATHVNHGHMGSGFGLNGGFGPSGFGPGRFGPSALGFGGNFGNPGFGAGMHNAQAALAHNAHVHDVHAHDVHAHDVHAHDVHGHDVHVHASVPGPMIQTAPGVYQRSLG